jgi:hypothetical protein
MKIIKAVLSASFIFSLVLFLSSCAYLHRVQIGEIDSNAVTKGKPFQILVSETGVNIQEIGGIARAVSPQANQKSLKDIENVIAAFQVGPRTGNPVYSEHYADGIAQMILRECPSGHITGLMSSRETAKYPVVSGEIIKVTGYCIKDGV